MYTQGLYINTYSGVQHVVTERKIADADKRIHQKYRRLDWTWRMTHPYCNGDKIAECGQVLSTAYRMVTPDILKRRKKQAKVCQHCLKAIEKRATEEQQEELFKDVMK